MLLLAFSILLLKLDCSKGTWEQNATVSGKGGGGA
jgi:hypothetical protein